MVFLFSSAWGDRMKNIERTKLERNFRRFDIISKILICFLAAITVILCILLIVSLDDERMLVVAFLIIADIAILIIVAPKLGNKRNAYLELLTKERGSVVRKGLFKEIYEAYQHDGFEMNLICDRWNHIDYYNNTIDISLQYRNHEIQIEIDENGIAVMFDEESDHPVEKEIPLESMETMEELYLTLNQLIKENAQ